MSSRGFTLIEMVIVVGIILVVAGLSIPFLFSYQVTSEVATYANDVERTLRRAQLQAINGYHGTSWGVYFDNNQKQFIIFQGNSYTSRDQNYDQEIDYPNAFNIASTFGQEIYFAVYSGLPSLAGTVTVTSSESLFSKSIIVNELGVINANN